MCLTFFTVQTKEKNYSIINIFPYFVLGFVGMIILRNLGDQIFILDYNSNWTDLIDAIKFLSKIGIFSGK